MRNADSIRREFSNSSTPERRLPVEPEVDASPVIHQTEVRDNRELGTPPALNISALSDNQGDVSRESGELNEETDITGETNINYNLRRSKRIPTAKRTHIPGGIIYS